MSLYTMLFGTNSLADVLLACLGISQEDVPRFRDCYLDGDLIIIHTRTGGGNRDYFDSEHKCRANYPGDFDGQDDPNGPWNDDLRALPTYLYDEDDDYDYTYADFYFSIPDEYRDNLTALTDGTPVEKPSEKWQKLIAALEERE